MQAFHNSPKLKQMYVTNQFFLKTKEDYLQLIGIPVWFPYLVDIIGEGLSKEDKLLFDSWVLPAIPIGVDLHYIKNKLSILRHKKQLLTLDSESHKNLAQNVIDYLEEDILTDGRNFIDREELYRNLYYLKGDVFQSLLASVSSNNSKDDYNDSITFAAKAEICGFKWAAHYKWEADTLIQLLKDSK